MGHCLALTTQGECFSLGENDFGQLWLGKETNEVVGNPTKINFGIYWLKTFIYDITTDNYKLTEEQNIKINEILNNERINKIGNLPKDIEKYTIEDYNAKEANSSYKGCKKEDWKGEDDEEGGGYHRTVNCSNQ